MPVTAFFFSARFTSSSASFRFMDSGFSVNTCLPWFRASLLISKWYLLGVQLWITSMPGSRTTSRQSVPDCSML